MRSESTIQYIFHPIRQFSWISTISPAQNGSRPYLPLKMDLDHICRSNGTMGCGLGSSEKRIVKSWRENVGLEIVSLKFGYFAGLQQTRSKNLLDLQDGRGLAKYWQYMSSPNLNSDHPNLLAIQHMLMKQHGSYRNQLINPLECLLTGISGRET